LLKIHRFGWVFSRKRNTGKRFEWHVVSPIHSFTWPWN
jgi:hypothetical protein